MWSNSRLSGWPEPRSVKGFACAARECRRRALVRGAICIWISEPKFRKNCPMPRKKRWKNLPAQSIKRNVEFFNVYFFQKFLYNANEPTGMCVRGHKKACQKQSTKIQCFESRTIMTRFASFIVCPVFGRGAVSYKTGLPEDWRGHSFGDFLNSLTVDFSAVFCCLISLGDNEKIIFHFDVFGRVSIHPYGLCPYSAFW